MTSEWHEVPLRELVGYISKGIAPSYAEEASETTIRVLNQKCNRNFRISYGDSRLHDTLKKKVPPERYVKPDDILINSTGAGTAGRIAQIEDVPSATTIDGHMILIRSNRKVTQKFLGYALKAHQWEVLQLDEGSTGQTELNRDRLLDEIMINYPVSFDEQNAIVGTLESIDRKLIVNEQLNDNLEQQAQALYKAWFVDLIPYNRVMPSDWFNGTVDDLAKEIICGKTPSTKIPEYYGGDIPFITIPDMHGKIYTISTERCLSTYGANTQAKKTLPKNAICVSCIGTAGLVTLVASKSQTNQQINSIIPKDNFSPYYIYLLMQTLSEVINKLGQGGSTIVNLSKAQFGKIKVCIPSVATMRGFDEIVAPLFTMILKNQKEIIRLSSLRDTLLPKLMSGELDVSAVQL